MSLTTGTILQNGKYVLDAALGQAGFGITYRATSNRLEQPVVIKTLNPDLQSNADFANVKRRFLEEAQLLTKCQHPNIARGLEVFEEGGLPFLVMDYVPGQSLATLVQADKPLPEIEAIHCIRQIGSALRVLHHHHLLHRGIKPKNLIRCDRTDFVVLVGFGIAQGFAPQTVPQQGVLSAGYAALEQYFPQKELTPATDVYGLAATLYYLSTGQTPIAAPLRDRQPLPTLRQLQPHLSAAIEQAVLQGMAVEAHLRPQTIQDWLALLPSAFAPSSLNGSSGKTVPPAPAASPTLPSHPPTSTPTLAVAPGARPAVVAPTSPTKAIATPVAASPSAKSSNQWGKVLGITSAIAIAVGISFGLAVRLGGSNSPGSTFFNTEQSFPPSDKWPGTKLPDEPVQSVNSDPVPVRAAPDPDPPVRRVRSLDPDPQPPQAPVPIQTPSPTATASPQVPIPAPTATASSDPAPASSLPPQPPPVTDPVPSAAPVQPPPSVQSPVPSLQPPPASTQQSPAN